MNRWQSAFVAWNAQRLGIQEDASRERFNRSLAATGGHAGPAFDRFGDASHKLFQVFASDDPAEVLDAYRLHARLHFLRMLAYPECAMSWTGHPILAALGGQRRAVVSDLGCGLAQTSLTLAEALQAAGTRCEVCLADIETIRTDFALWLCGHLGLQGRFIACDGDPVAFPESDVIVATEIFEHLHEPLPYLIAVDHSLLPGGFLVTSIGDHAPGYMHVTPELGELRTYLHDRGYAEMEKHRLYRKPC